jgi:hypothetical protein
MLKHIVMWRMKDQAEGASAEQNAQELKRRLESLEAVIPEILELEVGLQFKAPEPAWDVVLVSAFENPAALEIYQKNPEHEKVVEFVKKIISDRKVVDYEI